MKITFTTNPQSFEKAIYLFRQAVAALEGRAHIRERLGFTEADIKKMKVFRKQLVKGFLKASEDK